MSCFIMASNNYSHCPFCLLDVLPSETTDSSDLFKKFVKFSKVYLKVSTGETLFLAARITSKPPPRFCEPCEEKVKEVLELHWELEKLNCKLIWKLITIGEIIGTTQKKTSDGQATVGLPTNHSAMSTSACLLKVFGKQVARKCIHDSVFIYDDGELKARRILPDVTVEYGGGPIKVKAKQLGAASQMEIQCPFGFVDRPFEKVIAESRIITVPTRQTLRMFASLLIVYSIGNDWNLEKIILHSQNSEPRQHKVFRRKRGRPPGTRVNVENFPQDLGSTPPPPPPIVAKRGPGRPPKLITFRYPGTAQNSSGIPGFSMPPIAPGVKRGPGRPPKSCANMKPLSTIIKRNVGRPKMKRGRPGRPRLNVHSFIQPELLPSKRGVGRPKKIRLGTEQNLDAAFIGRETRFIENLVEKAEVEIPSPEPSMIDVGFQEDDCDAESYFCNNSVHENLAMPPMDVANEEYNTPLHHSNEGITPDKCDDNLGSTPARQSTDSEQQDSPENISTLESSPPVKRKRGPGRPPKFHIALSSVRNTDSGVVRKNATNSTLEKSTDGDNLPPQQSIKVEQQEGQQGPSVPKRKRGRPFGGSLNRGPVKMKRGRPPKPKSNIDIKPEPAFVRRRVGRPKIKGRGPGRPPRQDHINTDGSDLSQNFTIRCSLFECGKNFSSLFPYQEHLQKVHPKNTPVEKRHYECTSCEDKFDSELSLMGHVEKSHENSEEKASHFCVHCHKSFRTEQLCELHKRNIHWLHSQHVHCEVDHCSEELTSTRDLYNHYTNIHCVSDDTDLKLFSCDKCHWPFLNKRRLRLHLLSHLEPSSSGKEDGYQCPTCPNRYPSAMRLAYHFNIAVLPYHCNLNQKLKTWNCSSTKCHFSFFSEKEFKAHQKLHEQYNLQHCNPTSKLSRLGPGRRVQIVCAYCSDPFATNKARSLHEKQCPSGSSPEKLAKLNTTFACGKCNFASNNRAQMHRHSNIHKEAKFPCLECDKKFGRADHLQRHVQCKHSNHKFVCHICGAKRATESDLKYHVSEHERKHLCPDCGQKFTRAWLLSVHMRKHTGERIQCEWCPTFYRTVPQLKSHYQSGHPEEFQRVYGGNMKMRVQYKLVKREQAYANGRPFGNNNVRGLETSQSGSGDEMDQREQHLSSCNSDKEMECGNMDNENSSSEPGATVDMSLEAS